MVITLVLYTRELGIVPCHNQPYIYIPREDSIIMLIRIGLSQDRRHSGTGICGPSGLIGKSRYHRRDKRKP
jgi:hypothetical protein